MKLRIINKSNNPNPAYATPQSAGMDLRAFLDEAITLLPGERILVPTGIFIELAVGYEAQIRPRSGLAINSGITMLNSPGTIDADYRGEIKVIAINHGKNTFIINSGDKIAQMVIAKHETISWENVEELSDSERNHGGFGSTGNT
jgi:dUTP pyrophosphatase